jgi:adenosine deaminase
MSVALPPEQLKTFIARLPKAELHLHLEGSISPVTLLRLARRNNVELPAMDEAGLTKLFEYQSFKEFLSVFMLIARALCDGQDFEEAAYELGAHLAGQSVYYAEVMISPVQYYRRGLNLDEVVQGAAAGLARAGRDFGLRTVLVFDYGRQFGVDLAWEILEIALRNHAHGVVGWSIGGDELLQPPEPFVGVFQKARMAGLRLMAHAGEVVGPQSVWGAVDVLGVERLGHGIRSIDDRSLLVHLEQRKVVLDVCPTSNVRTGAVPSLAEHPLRRLYDAGVHVTINTDDPIFFHTTMNAEYLLAAQHFGFSAAELADLSLNSVRAAFLPDPDLQPLIARFERDITALRAEYGV